ncbi:MAG: LacI family DNA-binding transcriptional regulator [Kiritimatiellae bacterium]|jgi:LacI family transcriptional regulator|nr:LacI family DNA-binding transcriptional regulator [Kiritimatiellia bacterium]
MILTIRELATQLGLSKSTVAAALRGNGGISEKTSAWVHQRARELGYEPNPLTSALLRQVRSGTAPRVHANVALLLDANPDWDSAYIERLCRGFRERASVIGLVPDEINTWNLSSEKIMRILVSRGIEGLALLPLPHPMGHRRLDWSKFAAVSFGYSMALPRLSQVVHNHFHGITTAYRMCHKKGFRRIGIALNQGFNLRSNGLWMAGFLEAQRHAPASDHVRPLIMPDQGLQPLMIEKWLREEVPEVVILHKLHHPEFVLPDMLLESSRPAIPILLDGTKDSPCACIDQNYECLGAAMADQLSHQLIQNQRGIPSNPALIMFDGTWIDHPSLVPHSK